MASMEEYVSTKNELKTFCARGTNISLYSTSSIFCFSKMLSAILERWHSTYSYSFLDIDPQSFHFLNDYCNHIQESQSNPSKINDNQLNEAIKKAKELIQMNINA